MLRESGIERSAMPRSVNIEAAQGGKGKVRECFSRERPSAVFLLGRTHHQHGDCGCEPAHQLTVAARMGEIVEKRTPPRAEQRARQWRRGELQRKTDQ